MPKMSARTVVNVILIIVSLCLPVAVNSGCKQKPVIFNFGDSNSDTGGFVAGLGLTFGPPNGRSFSHQPQSGRLCDGRLIIDFLCEFVCTISTLCQFICKYYICFTFSLINMPYSIGIVTFIQTTSFLELTELEPES